MGARERCTDADGSDEVAAVESADEDCDDDDEEEEEDASAGGAVGASAGASAADSLRTRHSSTCSGSSTMEKFSLHTGHRSRSTGSDMTVVLVDEVATQWVRSEIMQAAALPQQCSSVSGNFAA